MVQVAIFASGGGSNAAAIIKHFTGHNSIKISHIFCNRQAAGVFNVAEQANINTTYLNKHLLSNPNLLIQLLQNLQIDCIVLAGYLLKIDALLVEAYPNKILNIHPALLPKFGGQGMYGQYVHQAVRQANETETGITIHLVNQNYDEGTILFSASCPVLATDNAIEIGQNVLKLEHEHYPKVIENYIDNYLID
jgi:phosphoribosylglycinamide formyltransferase 1